MFFLPIARQILFVLHTFQRAVINLNDLLTERRETKTKKSGKNGKDEDEDDHKKQWNIVNKIHKRHSKRNVRCLPYLLRDNELFVLCGKDTTNCRMCNLIFDLSILCRQCFDDSMLSFLYRSCNWEHSQHIVHFISLQSIAILFSKLLFHHFMNGIKRNLNVFST